jgi:hypothetical protein
MNFRESESLPIANRQLPIDQLAKEASAHEN